MDHENKETFVLTNQAISKILDFKNVPLKKDDAALRLPHYVPSQKINGPSEKIEGPSEKKASKITRSKVILIVTAWLILALTAFAVVGKVGFQFKFPFSFGAMERTNGYLLHTAILALAVCVLGLTTWLYSKNKIGGLAIVVVIIGTILSASLPLLTVQLGIATSNAKKLITTFSSSSPRLSPPSSPSTPVVAFTDIVVNGILYSEDNAAALIGPRIVHEGDIVGGVTVIKVHKDKVEFEKNGRRWTQTVGETSKAYRR